jgi:hypothetical protein
MVIAKRCTEIQAEDQLAATTDLTFYEWKYKTKRRTSIVNGSALQQSNMYFQCLAPACYKGKYKFMQFKSIIFFSLTCGSLCDTAPLLLLRNMYLPDFILASKR